MKINNREGWDTLCKLMDHNQDRFAADKDSFAMFRLITDFFLNELKLDFVTKEEIDHIIGEEVGFDLLHDFIIFP